MMQRLDKVERSRLIGRILGVERRIVLWIYIMKRRMELLKKKYFLCFVRCIPQQELTSAPIGAWKKKLETMTDQQESSTSNYTGACTRFRSFSNFSISLGRYES